MPGDFFDTNIVLYIASQDLMKASRAETLIAAGGTISVQVLNEVASVARRKMRASWTETRELLASLRALLSVRPITLDVHAAGLALAERYKLSIYDAMIAASALDASCDRLWSEDMQDGMTLEALGRRLQILNPFVSPRPAR